MVVLRLDKRALSAPSCPTGCNVKVQCLGLCLWLGTVHAPQCEWYSVQKSEHTYQRKLDSSLTASLIAIRLFLVHITKVESRPSTSNCHQFTD